MSDPASDTETSPAPTNLVSVKLTAPHRHGGVEHEPGDKIEVRPDQKEWLKSIGKIA